MTASVRLTSTRATMPMRSKITGSRSNSTPPTPAQRRNSDTSRKSLSRRNKPFFEIRDQRAVVENIGQDTPQEKSKPQPVKRHRVCQRHGKHGRWRRCKKVGLPGAETLGQIGREFHVEKLPGGTGPRKIRKSRRSRGK